MREDFGFLLEAIHAVLEYFEEYWRRIKSKKQKKISRIWRCLW